MMVIIIIIMKHNHEPAKEIKTITLIKVIIWKKAGLWDTPVSLAGARFEYFSSLRSICICSVLGKSGKFGQSKKLGKKMFCN